MNPRVKSVQCKIPYSLIVTFTNQEVKEFNIQPYLVYPIFNKLKDQSYFMKAHVENGVVLWDDETDFDPDTIYLEGISIK